VMAASAASAGRTDDMLAGARISLIPLRCEWPLTREY
jgi:hypothetical protein